MRFFKEKLNNRQRAILITAVVILVISLSAGGVYAYLKWNAGKVDNSFTHQNDLDPTIVETFDGNAKTNVAVNVGNRGYSVYVRVAVVPTWVATGSSDQVHATAPVAGVDYTISLNTTDWFLGSDGYYYHKQPVNNGQTSSVLINECRPVAENVPDGFDLNVKVIAQVVQALGTTDGGNVPAVQDAWKVVNVDSSGNLEAIAP